MKNVRRSRRRLNLAAVVATVFSLLATMLVVILSRSSLAAPGELTQVTGFGSNPGNLQMFEWIPTDLPANAPVVVVMHPCQSNASTMLGATAMAMFADRFDFAMVFPQHDSSNFGCFSWQNTEDITRDSGEALSIKQMVDWMHANRGTDPSRVYAMGFSGGAFFTNVMLATYPDVFKAGASIAGGPYKCGSQQACSDGINKTPQEWGDLARSGFPGYTGPKPRMSIWHGTSDGTVAPMNLTEQMEQWTNYHGIDQNPEVTDTVKGKNHTVHQTANGTAVVETYSLQGAGHVIADDPGTAEDQCDGSAAYSSDQNICASFWILQWFGLTTAPPPTTTTTTSSTTTTTAPTTTTTSSTTTTTAPAACTNPTTVTFSNSSTDDGYVKAFSDGTSVEAITGGTGMAMGRSGFSPFKHMRTLLSFDTASIPDGATICEAFLTLSQNFLAGDPWADPAGNSLVVDVKTGCFGGACTTQTDDWSAAATQAAVASVPKWTSGNQNSSDFNSAGLSAINKTGKTQAKLLFTQFQVGTNKFVSIWPGSNNKMVVLYQ